MIGGRTHTSKIALVHLMVHIFQCLSLSPEDSIRYIGKSGIPTQNVLAICDFDMLFTYVSVGQPGAMHDTSVLYNAISVDERFFPHPPKGNILAYDHTIH